MKQVVVAAPVLEEHKKILEAKAPGCHFAYAPYEDITSEMLSDANIIFGNVKPELLCNCSRLELLQLNSAGVEPYIKDGVLPQGAVITCATGAYGLALAEHMLGMLLGMKKKLYVYNENQRKHVWRDEGSVTGIYGTRTLIVGFGDIGMEFAKLMKAMGSHVVGIRRTEGKKAEFADEIFTLSSLEEQLSLADTVLLALPGTPSTKGLINRERLLIMKSNAFLMNVGRGNAIDMKALCEVMKAGHLSGVALDVTEPEPLPVNHPLWDIENVHITPHISGEFHMKVTLDRIVGIAADNINRLLEGKQLKNIVDVVQGYRKPPE